MHISVKTPASFTTLPFAQGNLQPVAHPYATFCNQSWPMLQVRGNLRAPREEVLEQAVEGVKRVFDGRFEVSL